MPACARCVGERPGWACIFYIALWYLYIFYIFCNAYVFGKEERGGRGGVGPSPGFTPDHLPRGAHHPGLHPSRSSPGCALHARGAGQFVSSREGPGQALHFLVPWWSHVLDRLLPGCY